MLLFLKCINRGVPFGCFISRNIFKATSCVPAWTSHYSFWSTSSAPKSDFIRRSINKTTLIPCCCLQKMVDSGPSFKSRHKKDKISTDFTLIYENNSTNYIYMIIFLMPFTTIMFAVSIYLFLFNDLERTKELLLKKMSSELTLPIILFGIALNIGIAIGLTMLYRKTLFRIYKNLDTEQFIAVLPCMTRVSLSRNLPFTLKDVEHFEQNTLRGSLKIKGRAFLTSPSDFVLPKFFNELHGYYQPVNVEPDLDIEDLKQKTLRALRKK